MLRLRKVKSPKLLEDAESASASASSIMTLL
ncbi:MAG: hypothetical protein ACI9RZ_002615 [Sphingobacteriales bacterium]